jgi:hypothetical protein
MTAMEPHPIRLTVADDLVRSRLTVFFRILLAIPHIIWIVLWGIAVFFVSILSWFLVLFTARLPNGLHSFQSAYVRYSTHLGAYVFLAANPYPGFTGESGSYPIDVEIDEPTRQNRWKTVFRALLAVPAIALSSTLGSLAFGGGGGGSYQGQSQSGDDQAWIYLADQLSVALVVALLGWWVCIALGRAPLGFRDLVAYCLRYSAQALGYVLFLTDRYPNSDPVEPAATQPTPEKPIRIAVDDDLRRSRLTVFFRLLLTFPHLVWLTLWGIAVVFAIIAAWFATLLTGTLPSALHRFIAAYVRYQTHVLAFLFIVANPFPGFTGAAGSYPVDLAIDGPERQNRWKTAFRGVLVFPAAAVHGMLGGPFFLVGVFGWFVGLALGRMPEGLRNLGAYYLRYTGQTYGYLYLLTDSYPFAGPSDYVAPEEPEPEALPAWPDAPVSPSF